MSRAILVSASLIGVLLTVPSLAQEFREAPGNILAEGKVGLLGLQTVQDDLGLTSEQALKVRRILYASQEMKSDITSLIKTVWPEERPAKAAEVDKRLTAYSKEVAEKLQAVLGSAQMDRLEEIYVQSRGLQALFDDTVATKLSLTDQQKEKLNDARKKRTEALNTWHKSYPELSPQGSDERKAWSDSRPALVKEFDDAVLSTLSAEQRDQFKKMGGKEIEFRSDSERARAARRGRGGIRRDEK